MIRFKALVATLLLAALSLAPEVRGQEMPDSLRPIHMPPIVVTATRTATPPAEVGSALTVVTRGELERRQIRTVLDALRAVPGVSVAQAGPGGVASAFLRGAGADHALVLLDGIELNDPSAPNGAYDLAHLLTESVERIEIVRGPQSTLYGSSAMGGVIHILTRHGEGPASVGAAFEGGSDDDFRGMASVDGGSERVDYSATLTRRRTGGVSAASAPVGRAEQDEHDVGAFSGRVGWRPAPALSLDVALRASEAETDRDQEGPGGDDPNATTEADELSFRAEGRMADREGRWTISVGGALADHDRASEDEVDERRPLDRSRGTFDGRRWIVDALAELALVESQRLTIGVEIERETAQTTFRSESEFGPFESVFPEGSARTTGFFLQQQARFGGALFVTLGARLDDHSRFGAATTVRLAPALEIAATRTRLKASYGTGFKAPTLFQLFDPQFGDRDLDPEESQGWDAGVEQDLAGRRLRLGATVFATEFENMVAFEFPDGFRNVSASRARGAETWVSALAGQAILLRGGYTFTDSEDESGGAEDGRSLIRRPRHQASLDVDFPVGGRGNVSLGLRFVGEREDTDFSVFPSRRVTLDAYGLARGAASWRVAEFFSLFGRVENVFDANYEEVLHFGTSGREVFVGARAEL